MLNDKYRCSHCNHCLPNVKSVVEYVWLFGGDSWGLLWTR